MDEVKILSIMKDNICWAFDANDFNENIQKRVRRFTDDTRVVNAFILKKKEVDNILAYEIKKRKDILSKQINEKEVQMNEFKNRNE